MSNVKEMTPADVVAKCLDEGDPLTTREVPALALALLGTSRVVSGSPS